MFDISESTATLPQFERLHAAISDLRNKQIFFVGGTMKSGTTWLELLLNAHPRVSCNGEAQFVGALAPSLKQALIFIGNISKQRNNGRYAKCLAFPLCLLSGMRGQALPDGDDVPIRSAVEPP